VNFNSNNKAKNTGLCLQIEVLKQQTLFIATQTEHVSDEVLRCIRDKIRKNETSRNISATSRLNRNFKH